MKLKRIKKSLRDLIITLSVFGVSFLVAGLVMILGFSNNVNNIVYFNDPSDNKLVYKVDFNSGRQNTFSLNEVNAYKISELNGLSSLTPDLTFMGNKKNEFINGWNTNYKSEYNFNDLLNYVDDNKLIVKNDWETSSNKVKTTQEEIDILIDVKKGLELNNEGGQNQVEIDKIEQNIKNKKSELSEYQINNTIINSKHELFNTVDRSNLLFIISIPCMGVGAILILIIPVLLFFYREKSRSYKNGEEINYYNFDISKI